MLYLLDTNILVHLIRRDGIGEYIKETYTPFLIAPKPLISAVTGGELRSLAYQWKWGEPKKEQMNFALDYFGQVPVGKPEIQEAYAVIDSYCESIGQPMGKNDLWIAAAAYDTGATILTTDKDFDRLQSNFLTRIWIDPNQDRNQSLT